MEKQDEIVARKETSPMDYASQFLKDGGDLANLEKMMELQERYESNQARKAYHSAMSEFKKNPPSLYKDKDVAYGQTKYSHASLGKITEIINSALADHGLTASWKTDQTNGIQVTCTVTHILGYSESTSLKSEADNSGGKNAIQAIGSAITYLQRYTLLALTGLAAHDQDDDGKGSDSDLLLEKVKEEISLLKTVPDLTKYYNANIGKVGKSKKEFTKALAARKEEIVKELANADS